MPPRSNAAPTSTSAAPSQRANADSGTADAHVHLACAFTRWTGLAFAGATGASTFPAHGFAGARCAWGRLVAGAQPWRGGRRGAGTCLGVGRHHLSLGVRHG